LILFDVSRHKNNHFLSHKGYRIQWPTLKTGYANCFCSSTTCKKLFHRFDLSNYPRPLRPFVHSVYQSMNQPGSVRFHHDWLTYPFSSEVDPMQTGFGLRSSIDAACLSDFHADRRTLPRLSLMITPVLASPVSCRYPASELSFIQPPRRSRPFRWHSWHSPLTLPAHVFFLDFTLSFVAGSPHACTSSVIQGGCIAPQKLD
jgi:hypothetical protein